MLNWISILIQHLFNNYLVNHLQLVSSRCISEVFRYRWTSIVFYQWESNSTFRVGNIVIRSGEYSLCSIYLEWRSSKFDLMDLFINPLQTKLFYEYNTTSMNEQISLRPVLNIVEKGVVPREISSRTMMIMMSIESLICFSLQYILSLFIERSSELFGIISIF